MYSIVTSNLSKEYRSGIISTSIMESFGNAFAKREEKYISALNNISFKVEKGQILGIVGENGAGKSTLLKLLSRITYPTKGYFEINGRVSSLLEVGTGFHPELSGRENIYLNGTILGMKRREITEKFNAIVEFSGVGNYLEIPIKRYSSGMKVRLAFAVASHLNSEILLIDEVLAVGDFSFQKQSLSKMSDLMSSGRTILFVSHNLTAVKSICSDGIFLKNGSINLKSGINDVVSAYLSDLKENSSNLGQRVDRKGGIDFKFNEVIFEADNKQVTTLNSAMELSICLKYESKITLGGLIIRIQVVDQFSNILFTCSNYHQQQPFDHVPEAGQLKCTINKLPLNEGNYNLNLQAMLDYEVVDEVLGAREFYVTGGDFFGTGRLPKKGMGLLVDHQWAIE